MSAVREGYTKTGKPYGIAKVEDYSGSAEFAFFGNEWVEKKNFFYDWYVFIYAREMSAKTMAAGRMGGEDKYY